jgi:rhodanese-related sulfurtransferase
MKINLTKCLGIVLFSSLIGIFYNFVNPRGIPLISKPKEVKWATDSLVSSSIKNADTLIRMMKESPTKEEKPSINKKSQNIILKIKSDSIKQKETKQQTKTITDTDNGFPEPIGINLEQTYKLYTMGIIFIDARDESEYKSGHIKNAKNLSFYEFDNYKEMLSKISKSETIICYCGGSDCDISRQLANKLFSLGYRNIYIFIGGWEEWKAAGKPVE